MSWKNIATTVVLVGVSLLIGGIAAADTDAAERSFPLTEKWSIEKLLSLSKEQVIAIWKTLDPPQFSELDGHYMGVIPNAGDPATQEATGDVMYNENSRIGFWLGKAYKPTSATKGEGYNRWRLPNDTIIINQRFGTELGKSLIDGRPSFMMYYGHFRHELIPKGTENTLTDEIRKLDDNIYIGMGTVKLEDGSRSNPGHFVLVGPTDSWVGVPDPTMEKK